MTASTSGTESGVPATVAGVAAFALGYLVTWVVAGGQAAELTVAGPLGGAVTDWKAVAWVFFDSHFVGTLSPTMVGPGGQTAGGQVFDTVALLDVTYCYLVPPLVLFATGAAVAWLAGATGAREGLMTAAGMTVGYLGLAALLLLLSSERGFTPSPLRAVLIAGVLYPAAFGSLGGASAGALADGSTERGSETPTQ